MIPLELPAFGVVAVSLLCPGLVRLPSSLALGVRRGTQSPNSRNGAAHAPSGSSPRPTAGDRTRNPSPALCDFALRSWERSIVRANYRPLLDLP